MLQFNEKIKIKKQCSKILKYLLSFYLIIKKRINKK